MLTKLCCTILVFTINECIFVSLSADFMLVLSNLGILSRCIFTKCQLLTTKTEQPLCFWETQTKKSLPTKPTGG